MTTCSPRTRRHECRRLGCLAACALAALAAGACQSNPSRIDIWPIYYHEELNDRKTTEILWPFGGSKTTDDHSEAGAWPFFTTYKDEDKPGYASAINGIYPFFIKREDAVDSNMWVLPTFLRTSREMPEGERKTDYTVFPLFFWGTSPSDQKYFAFFPIYGTLKNRLARDENFFVLFPIYNHSRINDHHSKNVLFPIISWSYGGGRRAHRVIPFYTFYHKEGEPELWSFLWPIVHFSKSDGTERVPRSMFMIWPLFGWDNDRQKDRLFVLWPFFSYDSVPNTDYYNWIGPWPFFRLQKGRDVRRTQIWPFYGQVYEKGVYRKYVLWPLLRWSNQDAERVEQHDWSFAMFLQTKHYHDKVQDTKADRIMCWPLWRYFKQADGSKQFVALAPLYYWDEYGFERNYSRFWRVFEYVENPKDDETSYRFIWRVVRYDKLGDYSTLNVLGPLFRYEHEKEKQSKYSLLSGLLTVGSRGGSPVFKLFWIPFANGKDPEKKDGIE